MVDFTTRKEIDFKLESGRSEMLCYDEKTPEDVRIWINSKELILPEKLALHKVGFCQDMDLVESVVTMEENGFLDYALSHTAKEIAEHFSYRKRTTSFFSV